MFRKILRKNQEFSKEECIEILKTEKRGVLSVIGEDGYPYGMPMNHYYNEEDGKIYFHGAKFGHKIDSMKDCNKVSFCVYDKGIETEGKWSFKALTFKSVIVFGKVHFIEDIEKILDICRKLSLKFTDDLLYIEDEIKTAGSRTLCFAIEIEHITGKKVIES